MNTENKLVSWTRIGILCGSVITFFVLAAFIYYFINFWLPNQERKKTEIRIQEIEKLLKTNL